MIYIVILSWCCGSVSCVLCELCTVKSERGYGCALCDVQRETSVSLPLSVTQRTSIATLTLNSTQLTQYTRHAATAPTQRNDVNQRVVLNCNFSKEQCVLPEDDRMIETCRSVLSVLM